MDFRRRLGTALVIILVALTSGSAQALFKPHISLSTSGSIIINGKAVVHFQAGNGTLSASQRAALTYQRLAQFIDEGIDPSDITASGNKRQAKVVAGDRVICIATAADAKKSHTNRLTLASIWAAAIRQQLSMPAVTVSDNSLTVPLGEKRRVKIGGAATGPIYASPGNSDIVAIEVGADGRYIEIAGRQIGATAIDISVEGERVLVGVDVKKYAGSMPGLCTAKVTGNPCPSSLVSYAARQIASQSATVEAGASVEIGRVIVSSSALKLSSQHRAKVEVKISGPGYIPYSTLAQVDVQNVEMPRGEASQLFYSNDPERLLKYQTLFAGQIDPDQPTRILYHHQNMMRQRVHLIVELINPSSSPASFRVFGGIASPSVDTVAVGHIAGAGFLRSWQDNVSVIERVPPASRLILVSNTLGYQDTASGILQVTNLNGERAFVKIVAAEPGVDNVWRGRIASASDPLMLKMSENVYPNPNKVLDAQYRVGEQWAFIPLGKHALDDTTAQNKLYGNYGVLYTINVKMENPTGERRTVSVLFDPSAGIASGVFLIDGKLIIARSAQPPAEVPLISYRLGPGEAKNIRIITVPLAGSNYPANLVVRS